LSRDGPCGPSWSESRILLAKASLLRYWKELTPFNADLAASLAFLLPLVGLAAEPVTYASAIALEELAISAAAVRPPYILSLSSIFGFVTKKVRTRGFKQLHRKGNKFKRECQAHSGVNYLSSVGEPFRRWYPGMVSLA